MSTMFRYFSYLLLLAVAVGVVVFATSNNSPVAVDLWPLAEPVEMPVYFLPLGGLAIGLVLGRLSGAMGALDARRRAWLGARRAARLERELEAARESGARPGGGGILARRRVAAGDD